MGLFADIKTPYVNSITLKRILSPAVKENIFQGIMLKPNEAVTEKFSTDTDAAEIQVLRQKPLANDARELGADENGAWFNSQDAQYSSTEAYGIQIVQTIDRTIIIPTNAQDMVNIDLAEGETKNLGGLVRRNINAMTIAAQVAKNFNNVAGYDKKNANASAESIDAVANNWITKGADDKWVDLIIDALAKLDDGNADQGIDAYPDDQRAIIIRPSIKAEVLKGMTGLYGGTAVFDVLKKGGLDTDTKPAIATDGYVGTIGNTPVYCLAAQGWKETEKYLGLPNGALDNLAAIVCSAVGTGRALAFNSVIKIVDARGGQGLELQPKYRFGAECWDALSVVPIFSATYVNPVAGTSSCLFLRGIGSRKAVATPTEDHTTTSGKIAFATTTDGASIYYTDDGSIPSVGNGTLYSAAVSMTSGKTYKAVAFKNGTYSGVVSYTNP